MKARPHIRFHPNNAAFEGWIASICHRFDDAIAPLATAFLVLGLIAAFLQITRPADYLMATGLLFHLTIWFAGWLRSAKPSRK
jgi:hypothetical protein